MDMAEPPFELAVERFIGVPPEKLFHVWVSRLEEWWAPKPWTTRVIEMELRPGGRSAMVMSGPDGASVPIEGVILEVVPNERILSTDAFSAGWKPQAPFMVGFFTFTPKQGGTLYRAGAWHWTKEAHDQHLAMGFIEGWTKVATQLAALAEAATH